MTSFDAFAFHAGHPADQRQSEPVDFNLTVWLQKHNLLHLEKTFLDNKLTTFGTCSTLVPSRYTGLGITTVADRRKLRMAVTSLQNEKHTFHPPAQDINSTQARILDWFLNENPEPPPPEVVVDLASNHPPGIFDSATKNKSLWEMSTRGPSQTVPLYVVETHDPESLDKVRRSIECVRVETLQQYEQSLHDLQTQIKTVLNTFDRKVKDLQSGFTTSVNTILVENMCSEEFRRESEKMCPALGHAKVTIQVSSAEGGDMDDEIPANSVQNDVVDEPCDPIEFIRSPPRVAEKSTEPIGREENASNHVDGFLPSQSSSAVSTIMSGNHNHSQLNSVVPQRNSLIPMGRRTSSVDLFEDVEVLQQQDVSPSPSRIIPSKSHSDTEGVVGIENTTTNTFDEWWAHNDVEATQWPDPQPEYLPLSLGAGSHVVDRQQSAEAYRVQDNHVGQETCEYDQAPDLFTSYEPYDYGELSNDGLPVSQCSFNSNNSRQKNGGFQPKYETWPMERVRNECDKYGLKVGGVKEDMIDRLVRLWRRRYGVNRSGGDTTATDEMQKVSGTMLFRIATELLRTARSEEECFAPSSSPQSNKLSLTERILLLEAVTVNEIQTDLQKLATERLNASVGMGVPPPPGCKELSKCTATFVRLWMQHCGVCAKPSKTQAPSDEEGVCSQQINARRRKFSKKPGHRQ
eukprot:PhF_6_TR25342/c0_g1_i1/m.35052